MPSFLREMAGMTSSAIVDSYVSLRIVPQYDSAHHIDVANIVGQLFCF